MRLNSDFSIWGDVQYARLNGQVTQYFDLGNHFSLGVNAEVGYGTGLNGKEYPVFKNFYGGGLGSVRVFEQGSLGKESVDVTGGFIGGAKKFNFNNELYIPVPGADKDKSLRLFAFFDAGNVWSEREHFDFTTLRASAGLEPSQSRLHGIARQETRNGEVYADRDENDQQQLTEARGEILEKFAVHRRRFGLNGADGGEPPSTCAGGTAILRRLP